MWLTNGSYGVVDDEELTTLKNNCGALLSRQYHIVLPVTFFLYVVMQIAVGSFMMAGGCREHAPVAEWTKQVNVAAAGCFLLSAFHHVTISILLGSNWYSSWVDLAYPRAVYISAALVSLVAGISACIKIVEQYQYVCVDALGVPTFPSQWPEWMTDVPLLGYIAIAIEDKEFLEVEDVFLVFGMFMMIFGGFVMNLTEDVPTAVFFLILSCLCICGNYYLAQDASRVIEVKTQVLMEGSMADGGGESPVAIKAQWALGRVLMKGRLSWLLLVLYPMFVGAYALRLFHYISNDVFWVANLGFSVLAKLVFVGVLSLESVLMQIQQKQHDARRRVMHDRSAERVHSSGATRRDVEAARPVAVRGAVRPGLKSSLKEHALSDSSLANAHLTTYNAPGMGLGPGPVAASPSRMSAGLGELDAVDGGDVLRGEAQAQAQAQGQGQGREGKSKTRGAGKAAKAQS